jgi:hypothetical protein
MKKQHPDMNEGLPPLFKSWQQVYIAVLIMLIGYMGILFLFGKWFSRAL